MQEKAEMLIASFGRPESARLSVQAVIETLNGYRLSDQFLGFEIHLITSRLAGTNPLLHPLQLLHHSSQDVRLRILETPCPSTLAFG